LHQPPKLERRITDEMLSLSLRVNGHLHGSGLINHNARTFGGLLGPCYKTGGMRSLDNRNHRKCYEQRDESRKSPVRISPEGLNAPVALTVTAYPRKIPAKRPVNPLTVIGFAYDIANKMAAARQATGRGQLVLSSPTLRNEANRGPISLTPDDFNKHCAPPLPFGRKPPQSN